MAEERGFHEIAHSFAENMTALRILNEEIGKHADERDEAAMERITSLVCRAAGIELEELASRAKASLPRSTDTGQPNEPHLQDQTVAEGNASESLTTPLDPVTNDSLQPLATEIQKNSRRSLRILTGAASWPQRFMNRAYWHRFRACCCGEGR